MAVFWTHAFGLLLLADEATNRTLVRLSVSIGEGAVSCFFVLSGFVLVWVARPGEARREFWQRRVARIAPNHLVTWTAGLLLLIAFSRGFNPLALLPSLTLTQVWVPHSAVLEGTNPPAWSLACEAFFYLLFPFLYRRVSRMGDATVRRAAWLVGGAIVAWTVIVAVGIPTEPRAEQGLPVPLPQFYALIFIPPLRLLDFTLGMLVAELVRRELWRPLGMRRASLALAGGWAASLLLPPPIGYVAPWLPAIVLFVAGGASAVSRRTEARGAAWRWLVWLGEVSFAFYLVHWLVLTYAKVPLGLEREGGEPLGVLVYLVVCLAASLLIAQALRRWVEQPAARRLRPRAAPERDPLDALAAAAVAVVPTVAASGLATSPAEILRVRAGDPDRAGRASSGDQSADRAGTRV